jgi:hypothetical protein
MDSAEWFRAIERIVVESDDLPAWHRVCREIALPDERWRRHDPALSLPSLQAVWLAQAPDWSVAQVLWFGIETDGTSTWLDPVGYSSLNETGLPQEAVWHGGPLESADLQAFTRYAVDGDQCYDAYDYAAPLAWTALAVRLLRPAPRGVTVLAGFGGGDWFVFAPTRDSR